VIRLQALVAVTFAAFAISSSSWAEPGDPTQGQRVFGACAPSHSLEPDRNMTGDGAFAIAFALMELVGAQISVAGATRGVEPRTLQSIIDEARTRAGE
jgi:cytochrome c2